MNVFRSQIFGQGIGLHRAQAFIWCGVFAFVSVLLAWTDADAIPAFARKYDMDCSHCHSMSPKLNPVGDYFHDNFTFKGIGRKLPEGLQEKIRSEDPEDLHPAYWPVSFRLAGGYQYDRRDQQRAGATLQTITTQTATLTRLELLAGGLVTEGISYYLTYYPAGTNIGLPAQAPLHSHPGATAGVGQTGAVGFAWVRIADVFGQVKDHEDGHDHEHADGGAEEPAHAHGFDVIFGAHELHVINSGHHRLTNTPYLIYRYIPQGHQTAFSLDAPQLGFGIDAAAPWFGYAISVYNGTSSGADDNRALDVFGNVEFDFGESKVGLFGLRGTTPLSTVDTIPGTGKDNQAYLRFGADASVYAGPLNVLFFYTYGQDDAQLFTTSIGNPLGDPVQTAKFHGGFLEADYLIDSARTLLLARYDIIRNLQQGIMTLPMERNDADAITLGLRHDLALTSRVNLQLHLEANMTQTKASSFINTDQRANTVYAGLDLSF